MTADRREPQREWVVPSRPLVVVSPHPDDETLLFGGLLAAHARRGLRVTVLAVTDGDAGNPLRDGGDLASVRRREQEQAVRTLSAGEATIHRLGMPDGRVARHVDDLADAIGALVAEQDPIVAVPSPLDHHADHVACADAAARVAERSSIVHGFFWAYHHAPGALETRPLQRFDLDDELRWRRWRSLAAYRTQVSGLDAERLLGPSELWPLRRSYELYEVGSS